MAAIAEMEYEKFEWVRHKLEEFHERVDQLRNKG